ncbi:MAG TPA: cytochrome P450 [Acidimicrobiales bacterium]|nr:cytochrome P450 [Acidimicrobiales bacterium]
MAQMLEDVDFALGGEVEDLHGVLRALRDHGPVGRVRYFGEPAWIFTTFESVEAAYRDDDLFPAAAAFKEMTEPVLGRNLQCMQGQEHKRNRMLVSPYFRLRVMPGQVQPILDEVANEIIDDFAGRGEAELIEEFNRRFPGEVISRIVGIPADRSVDLQHLAHRLLSFPSDPTGAIAARHEITHMLEPLAAQRRREPLDDLLSMLATTEIEGERLTDEEIFSFIRLLFGAGTDTTFFGLGNALYGLLTNADSLDRVLADPDDEMRWAVEETLRWESPVSMEPRRAPTETEWFAQRIEAGSRLLFGIAAANRDPVVFVDPDRFDVSRRPDSIMTFGIGPHFCLGAHLARAELTTALRILLARLADLRLVDAETTRIGGTVLRGPNRLQVRFRPQ